METSTKVILVVGLAAVGAFVYVKTRPPTGPALPKSTPALPPGTPQAAAPTTSPALANSPEVQAALSALKSLPNNAPEVQAAANAIQANPNSPEAQAALNLLQGLPSSPEAKAALDIISKATANNGPSAPTSEPTRFTPGVLTDAEVIRDGDRVRVDMLKSSIRDDILRTGLPFSGHLEVNVVSLTAPGDPAMFRGTFANPEYAAIFGPRDFRRDSVMAKLS